jgi:hypothetical protein
MMNLLEKDSDGGYSSDAKMKENSGFNLAERVLRHL